MNKKSSIALIGAGAMGGALLKGWIRDDSITPSQSAVFDPGLGEGMSALCREHAIAVNPMGMGPFDAMIIAVKPQMAAKILPAHIGLAKDAIVISVMAGTSIENLSQMLAGATAIARAMPNLPAAVGRGVTGVFAGSAIDGAGRTMIDSLLRASGEVVWVDREEDINAVTAISGSGPAYYFLLTEALAQAGEGLGLSPDASAKLARATLCGAGALMDVETRSPEEMRHAVTSPGGTTQAALDILDGDAHALRTIMQQAVDAAMKRAQALTK